MSEDAFLFMYMGFIGVPLLIGFIAFAIHTHFHLKYLNEREQYWAEKKRKREEKEK